MNHRLRINNPWVKKAADKKLYFLSSSLFYLVVVLPEATGREDVWDEKDDFSDRLRRLGEGQDRLVNALLSQLLDVGVDLAAWKRERSYRLKTYTMPDQTHYAVQIVDLVSNIDQACVMYDAMLAKALITEEQHKDRVYSECRKFYRLCNRIQDCHKRNKHCVSKSKYLRIKASHNQSVASM